MPHRRVERDDALGPPAAGLPDRIARPASRDRLQRRVEAWGSTGDDWLWEADAGGRFTYSGKINHCDYDADEIVSRRLVDMLHPEEHERMGALLATGQGWRDEIFHCVAKDGTDRWLRGSAVADLAEDGQVRAYVGTAQVLHRPAELERADRARRRFLQDLVDHEQLDIVFQPIVHADTGRLIGAEALARFAAPSPGPQVVFADAARVGLGVELELLAVRKALLAAATLVDTAYVSLNVSPAVLHVDRLAEQIQGGAIDPCRLVLEITEHESIDDYEAFNRQLDKLRGRGVRVAVDDAGAGFASFRHILKLRPEFIKLDRTLIGGIDQDAAKRALAAAVVMLGLDLGAQVTAEGVETAAEFETARALGIDAAQGYLLGRPTDDWQAWREWTPFAGGALPGPEADRWIRQLSLDGASAASIAARLNHLGLPSPRGKRWHATSVTRRAAELR